MQRDVAKVEVKRERFHLSWDMIKLKTEFNDFMRMNWKI